jgi:hypothetical protein
MPFKDTLDTTPPDSQVVASCLDTLGPVVLQDFTDKEDLALCLKASANIPVIAGPPMRHRCPVFAEIPRANHSSHLALLSHGARRPCCWGARRFECH